ncbi:MAG: phospholipase [Solirubrobacterales bacterium]|nr:phospholipase [Solirubrobacterales bacterium]
MALSPIPRIDAALGQGVERIVRDHHRRRLARLGHSAALEPDGPGPWVAGDPAPRPGNDLEVLIDGAQAMPAVAAALAAASSHVYVTGWHLAAHFELVRGEQPVVLGALLAELAERIPVRVLVWAGAPVPAFHPTRKEVAGAIEQLVKGTRVQCFADPREHPFHCHHEKTLVIDDEIAFVGGIDMTDMGGDRFDTAEHPARRRLGWHDVGTRLTGPAVTDVAEHFVMRWHEVTGERLPVPAPQPTAGKTTVQVVRTVAEDMYRAVPKGEFRILEAYRRALRAAQDFVYLENQFLWAPEIVDLLVDKLRSPPTDDFRVVLLLPRRANNGQDDTKGQLGRLVDADDGNRRFLAATIRSLTSGRADPLYVHAKVGIVDDRWLTIGSANLNAHSLMNDTEMNVVTDDRELARQTRERLWVEHLQLAPDTVRDLTPAQLVDDHWMVTAVDQLEREKRGAVPTHRLIALPGVSSRASRLVGPLSGLLDDG